MKCKQCGNEFSPGTGISTGEGAPEEFCKYSCMETWRRQPGGMISGGAFVIEGPIPDNINDLLADALSTVLGRPVTPIGNTGDATVAPGQGSYGSKQDNVPCNCHRCKAVREACTMEEARLDRVFGTWRKELIEADSLQVEMLSAFMRETGIEIGDLSIWMDAKDIEANDEWCRQQTNFFNVFGVKGEDSRFYVFKPLLSRKETLVDIIRNNLSLIESGPESKAVTEKYITLYEGLLSKKVTDETSWIAEAQDAIQKVMVELFGPKAAGHAVSPEDQKICALKE